MTFCAAETAEVSSVKFRLLNETWPVHLPINCMGKLSEIGRFRANTFFGKVNFVLNHQHIPALLTFVAVFRGASRGP